MKLNEGGSMSIELGILVAIVLCLILLWGVKKQSDKTDKLSLLNAENIEALQNETENLHKQLLSDDFVRVNQFKEWRESFSKEVNNFAENLKKRVDEGGEDLVECRDHLERLQKNDQVFVSQIASLNNRMSDLLSKPIKIEFPEMKSVGVSRVIKRDGKYYKQEVIKHKRLKSDDKFNMPGIKEAKDKIVEAGL